MMMHPTYEGFLEVEDTQDQLPQGDQAWCKLEKTLDCTILEYLMFLAFSALKPVKFQGIN
jgi:hypothetical protein